MGLDARVVGHRLKALDVERKHSRDGVFIDLTDPSVLDQLQYLFRKYHVDVNVSRDGGRDATLF